MTCSPYAGNGPGLEGHGGGARAPAIGHRAGGAAHRHARHPGAGNITVAIDFTTDVITWMEELPWRRRGTQLLDISSCFRPADNKGWMYLARSRTRALLMNVNPWWMQIFGSVEVKW